MKRVATVLLAWVLSSCAGSHATSPTTDAGTPVDASVASDGDISDGFLTIDAGEYRNPSICEGICARQDRCDPETGCLADCLEEFGAEFDPHANPAYVEEFIRCSATIDCAAGDEDCFTQAIEDTDPMYATRADYQFCVQESFECSFPRSLCESFTALNEASRDNAHDCLGNDNCENQRICLREAGATSF
ncbi:MAG: hypothetical protein IPK60_17030 [Sandaracinaceae bacterium]|nr:hypothetical protein [Sandaracinaceae bacterium]